MKEKLFISPKFQEKAQNVLRQFLEEGKTEGTMPEPFSNSFKVVLGKHEKAWDVQEIPANLKPKAGSETFYSIVEVATSESKTSI